MKTKNKKETPVGLTIWVVFQAILGLAMLILLLFSIFGTVVYLSAKPTFFVKAIRYVIPGGLFLLSALIIYFHYKRSLASVYASYAFLAMAFLYYIASLLAFIEWRPILYLICIPLAGYYMYKNRGYYRK